MSEEFERAAMSVAADESERMGLADRSAGLVVARLMRAGMLGSPLEELPDLDDGATWGRVLALAGHDGVEALTWAGLSEGARSQVPDEVRARWAQLADLTLMRQLQFDVERESVVAALEAGGLSWLPLKGTLIAGYYPAPGLRSMADNDLLYGYVEPAPDGGYRVRGASDAERRQTISRASRDAVSIMGRLGYRPEHIGQANHDSFFKEPMFNFELHRYLMSTESEQLASVHAYYANPWRHALQEQDDPLRFRFSPVEEYLFFLAHAYKHYMTSGCGVRFIADEWVLLGRYGELLEGTEMASKLKEAGLVGFERMVRELARAVFGGADGVVLSQDQEQLWLYLLGCGSYGNQDTRVRLALARLEGGEGGGRGKAVGRYLGRRLVPPYEEAATWSPILRGRRWLYPAFVVCRLVYGAVTKPGAIVRELRVALRGDKPKA